MCSLDFPLKGCPPLTPFACSSNGKEGVGHPLNTRWNPHVMKVRTMKWKEDLFRYDN